MSDEEGKDNIYHKISEDEEGEEEDDTEHKALNKKIQKYKIQK